MTIGELKSYLNQFEDSNELYVATGYRVCDRADVEIDEKELHYNDYGMPYRNPKPICVISVCDPTHNTYYC